MADFRFNEASDLDLLLFRQEGVLTSAQARRFFTRAAIDHRLKSGRWQRLHRGVMLTVTGDIRYPHRLWCASLACGPRALLAGPTAAAEDGLRTAPFAIHLLIPLERRIVRPPLGVIVHRTSVLAAADVHRMALPPRTRTARSIVDAAQWAESVDAARAVIADAFRRRLVGLDDVAAVLDRLPRARRRAVIQQAALDAAGGAHSLAELDYARLNRRAGLPEPSRQVIRIDATGRRRYLDASYDEWHLHVEIDGATHLDPIAWWADMKRQNDLWIEGDRVLRIPTWALRECPDEVFAQVRAALLAAGWPG